MLISHIKTILLFTLSLCITAYAERGEHHNQTGLNERPKTKKEMIERYDSDGDGLLSLQEFSQVRKLKHIPSDKVQKIFERFDDDKDNFISEKELPEKEHKRRLPPLHLLDKDGDSKVSKEEFQNHKPDHVEHHSPEKAEKLFNKLDKNGDGILSVDDISNGQRRKHRPHRPKGLSAADTDGDGMVSWTEFQQLPRFQKSPERARSLFDRLDVNDDGFLDLKDRNERRSEF